MKYKVLFVDDEEKILFSLKRLFRVSDWETHFVSSGEEGLKFLEREQVSVIVSDMKMPEMNGVEFLVKATGVCPDAVRIILSGYSESDKIMDAVNKGHIWQFVPKPWNNEEIKITIKNAIDHYKGEKERKELVEVLKQKTAELDVLNKHLEEKVQERTWQLNERTRLLNLMLEDEEIEVIILQSCIAISRLLDGKKVFIKSLLHKDFHSSADEPVPLHIIDLEKKSLASQRVITGSGSLAVPLCRADTRLGTVLVENSSELGTEKQIEGFTSLLDMALYQYKSLESTPELLNNIDKIIGSI